MVPEQAAFDAALEAERQRRQQILQTAALMRREQEPWQRSQGVGQIALGLVGTAASNQGIGIGEALVRASADTYVSDILLAEPDTMSRRTCLAELPAALRERVVPVEWPLLPSGLLGRTVSEGWALRQFWMADTQTRIDLWLMRLRRNAKPSCLILPVSPGGSAAQALPIIQRFREEYDQAPVFVIIVLDDKTDRRERNVPELLDLLGQENLVQGFLVLDNRRSSELFDQALALLLSGMLVAPWIDARPNSGFHIFPDVFRHHRVATLRAWVGQLPVRYEPAYQDILPEMFYTDLTYCQAQAIRGVEQVLSNAELQSLPLPAADHPQFVYVVAPIRPDPDFKKLAERVRTSPLPHVTYDTPLAFASVGHPLGPTSQQAPMMVVSVLPVPGGLRAVRDFVMGGERGHVAGPYLGSLVPLATESSTPLANGR